MELIVAGILLLLYGLHSFLKEKLLFPSVVFGFMWGIAFLLCGLVQNKVIYPEMEHFFRFTYINQYGFFFAIVSIIAFKIAHLRKIDYIYDSITINGLRIILDKYKWIMYLSFSIGIICIVSFIIHFNISSYAEYRITFVTTSLPQRLAFIFRLGNWIVMFSSVYVLLLGLYHGKTTVDNKELIQNFILYSTVQMSTGGRLFILYFIIYYLSAFTLGRYSAVEKSFLSKKELKKLFPFFVILLSLVSIMAIFRSENESFGDGKAMKKYFYITDGIRTTDYCIRRLEGKFSYDYGYNTFIPVFSDNMLRFRKIMHTSPLGATVYSILVPLYLDFGLFFSLFIWFFMALLIEWISLLTIRHLNIISFIVFLLLNKIMYESVIFNCFSQNYPFIELIIGLYIFRKRIFSMFY